MKNFKPVVLLLLIAFTMTSCLDLLRETVEGSGNVIKKDDYEISGFSKISIATGINAQDNKPAARKIRDQQRP